MPKKSKKRRAWTATEVRELKTMAKKKTAASQIARKLKRTEGATPAKGVQHRAFARFSLLRLTGSQFLSTNRRRPVRAGRHDVVRAFVDCHTELPVRRNTGRLSDLIRNDIRTGPALWRA